MPLRTRKLSRREREMMDIIYAAGHGTAAQVRERMAEPPTDAAVRTTLRSLVAKGHLRIEQDGPRYVYWPTVPREKARSGELAHVLETFFDGSAESAMVALLQMKGEDLSEEARAKLKRLIDQAAREGR